MVIAVQFYVFDPVSSEVAGPLDTRAEADRLMVTGGVVIETPVTFTRTPACCPACGKPLLKVKR